MIDCKSLPQEHKPVIVKNNNAHIAIVLICGIIIGACLVNIYFKEGVIPGYYTNETCSEMVTNASIIGAYQMINYTQSTGGIKIFYNDTIVDSNVCEYCDYLMRVNEEVKDE